MRRGVVLLFLGVVLASATAQERFGVPKLEASNFQHWLDYIRPSTTEQRWTAIPWRAQVWTAVREARRADKPVLIWAMNGHPLGCT